MATPSLSIADALRKYSPPAELFAPILQEQFKEQATQEVAPYFDKNLQLALKELEMAKTQYKQSLDLKNKQSGEAANQFKNEREFNFMNTLRGAQEGFAGRGTFNSGFRNEGIERLQTSEQVNVVDPFNLQQKQGQEGRDLGFAQFLDQNNLGVENAQLQADRARNEAIIQRQGQLQNAAIAKQKSGLDTYDRGFAQYLTSNQRLAA